MITPTQGRMVLFVLATGPNAGQTRPATIVRAWGEETGIPSDMVNLQVFTDGPNDGAIYAAGIYWATSVHQSEEKALGTWDWMPFQKGQAAKTEELERKLNGDSETEPDPAWGTRGYKDEAKS